MDDKINPSGNWVRRLSSLRIMQVSQSSSWKVGGTLTHSLLAQLKQSFESLSCWQSLTVESHAEKQVCSHGAVRANKWVELHCRANRCERNEDKTVKVSKCYGADQFLLF